MKVPDSRAERFLQAPDPAVRAVLVYGPDEGLVRERVRRLMAAVVPDLTDPFRVAEFGAQRLKDDPARLADEAAAMALTGGRRVVRVLNAGDDIAGPVKAFVENPVGDALVVLQGGDLPGRSSLRRIFEGKTETVAAVACYRDDQRNLPDVIRQALAEHGLSPSADALAYLAAHLGSDRQLTRRELEKLALYKAEPGTVELEDALACVGDTAAMTLDDLAFAVGAGDLPGLERSLARSLEEGSSPVAILRGVARHFQRLHAVVGSGEPAEQAMKRLRPPVFWKLTQRFMGQCQTWSGARLAGALGRLLEAEASCKESGAPAQALAARALLEIAANAPRRRG